MSLTVTLVIRLTSLKRLTNRYVSRKQVVSNTRKGLNIGEMRVFNDLEASDVIVLDIVAFFA